MSTYSSDLVQGLELDGVFRGRAHDRGAVAVADRGFYRGQEAGADVDYVELLVRSGLYGVKLNSSMYNGTEATLIPPGPKRPAK